MLIIKLADGSRNNHTGLDLFFYIYSMNKIEHIGIAVKDLEAANQVYAALLGVAHYKTETVESEGVNTSFFKAGPNKIELLEATNCQEIEA